MVNTSLLTSIRCRFGRHRHNSYLCYVVVTDTTDIYNFVFICNHLTEVDE